MQRIVVKVGAKPFLRMPLVNTSGVARFCERVNSNVQFLEVQKGEHDEQ